MSFKKHNWIRYGRQGTIVKIELCDGSGAKIDSFNTNNQEDYSKIIRLIEQKYGYSPKPTIDVEDSINFDKEKGWLKSDEKDLKW